MNDRITNPLFAAKMGYRGFTLVELMIVISLVAILAAISAPSISRAMERSRLNDLNRDIANGILEARSFAMSSGEAVFARVDIANDRVDFFLPANFQSPAGSPAMSCATADLPGTVPNPGDAGHLFAVAADEYGVEQELLGQDPSGEDILCFSPSGKVLAENGAVLESNCKDNNYMLWLGRATPQTSCPDYTNSEERDQRAIDNIYFIHVSYGGQVRVRQ